MERAYWREGKVKSGDFLRIYDLKFAIYEVTAKSKEFRQDEQDLPDGEF
jgi:hypothetical protein